MSAAATTSRAAMLSTSLRTASVRPLRPFSCGRLACRAAAARHRTAALLPPLRRRLYSTESPDAKTSPGTASPAPGAAASSKSAASSDVLERYRSRLETRAQNEGMADIDALRAAYAAKIQALRRRDAVVPEGAAAGTKAAEAQKASPSELAATEPAATEPAQPEAPAPPLQSAAPAAGPTPSPTSSTSRGARPLSSLLDLDKVRALPVDELTAIWRLRFAGDPLSLCAVIPAETYAAMEAAARARPQFVLPVPHPEQGAEIHFLQWTFDDGASASHGGPRTTPGSTVLFTQLAEYKIRGEFAQPHTTVTHYTDLATDCGVVLMQGQVAEGRGVSADNAQWLVMCLQRFYGAWAIPGTPGAQRGSGSGSGSSVVDDGAHARRLLLQWFAAGDPQFSIERLMEEVEKLV